MMPKWMRLLLWRKTTDGVQAYKRASEKLMELSSNVLNQCEKKPRVLGNKKTLLQIQDQSMFIIPFSKSCSQSSTRRWLHTYRINSLLVTVCYGASRKQ